MEDESQFIEQADYLLSEDKTLEQSFKKHILPFLKDQDYDAFSTLCYLLMGKEIKRDTDQFREENNLSKLPVRLDYKLAKEYDDIVSQWQNKRKQKWSFMVQKIISSTKKFYQKSKPILGMLEYLECCGNALIQSNLYKGWFQDRSDYLVSCFFALYDKNQIKKQWIKTEFVEKYETAHKFVHKYNICLPCYYAAIWESWVLSTYQQDTEEYFRSGQELYLLLSQLPNIYINFLYGHPLYPNQPRERVVMSDKGKMEPLATTKMPVPFYDYLPTFCSIKNKEDEYRARPDGKNQYFHPMIRTRMPCTQIYCKTDMYLYLKNAFQTIELENKREELEKYFQQGALDNKKMCESKRIRLSSEQIQEHRAEIEKRIKNKPKSFDWTQKINKRSTNIRTTLENANFNPDKILYGSEKVTGDRLIASAFAFGFSSEEAQQFFASNHYCLCNSIKRDIIIQYALDKGFSLKSCNDILKTFNEKIIKGNRQNNDAK
ncbi:MAG: hypothetical protein NC307_11600 [Roseburia sp.]|nr:hypothetical protein [Roseburia sp.]